MGHKFSKESRKSNSQIDTDHAIRLQRQVVPQESLPYRPVTLESRFEPTSERRNPLPQDGPTTASRGSARRNEYHSPRSQRPGAEPARFAAPQNDALYRPLVRNRNEIRLLRILPARTQQNQRSLESSIDIVECRLEYESMDRIKELNRDEGTSAAAAARVLDFLFSDMPTSEAENSTRNVALIKESLGRELGRQKVDTEKEVPIHAARKKILKAYFARSEGGRKEWLPPDVKLWGRSSTFENWLQTWIWSPLSGHEVHPEAHSDGYFALSYVWNDINHVLPPILQDSELVQLVQTQQAGGIGLTKCIEAAGLPVDKFTFSVPADSPQPFIIVNGRRFDVAHNLNKALRALREIPEVICGKRIWIDSLCINQKDEVEKSNEVPRMSEIYGNAERVVSWLGSEQDSSSAVLEALDALGESMSTEEEFQQIATWFFRNLRSEFVSQLTRLMNRPYWTRIWIVQEIAMANDKSITICGSRRFGTSNLLKFGARVASTDLRFLPNQYFKLANNSLSISFLNSGIAKFRDLRALQANLEKLQNEPTSSSTLWFQVASGNYATDPRDLLYGMLSLLPKTLVAQLKVDYSDNNTYKDVMVNFALTNMKTNESLNWILHRPWSPFHGWQSWPSWVPNLGLRFSTAHFHWVFADESNASAGFKLGLPLNIRSTQQSPLLLCDGIRVDIINQATGNSGTSRKKMYQELIMNPHLADEVAQHAGIPSDLFRKNIRSIQLTEFPEPVMHHDRNFSASRWHRYENISGLKRALMECFQRLKLAPENPNESLFDIPLPAIEAESGLDSKNPVMNPTVEFSPLHILNALLKAFADFDMWGVQFRDLFVRSVLAGHRSAPRLIMEDRTCVLGRLFTSCSGYVGASLCALVPGDEIWILPSCKMPVALRPSEKLQGAFELLGGICVPGIMNGEAIHELSSGKRSTQKITII